jgi:hypothetical protein
MNIHLAQVSYQQNTRISSSKMPPILEGPYKPLMIQTFTQKKM